MPRAYDELPLWARLDLTHQCNLACGYCTEYDNSKDRVPCSDLCARIDHSAALVTARERWSAACR